MAELVITDLKVRAGGKTLLGPLSAVAAPGAVIAVVGANGAGKSTLLRGIAGLAATAGDVSHGGQSLAALAPLARARHIAYLPQVHDFAWAMPVRATVALGRYAFADKGAAATPAIDAALAMCGLDALADRPVDRLSGGERALTALARILVADTPLLLLDEPVAALDAGRQYAVLETLAALAATGKTIIAVLHDLALAAQFADRIWWINDGLLVEDTAPERAAIDRHAGPLLGRTPQWAAGKSGQPLPYFSR